MTVHSRAEHQAKPAALPPRVGYPSPVCSSMGDAVDRIAAAIDQLATDVQAQRVQPDKMDEPEMATRVADLWQMVSDLDPELARRKQGYAKPVDGTPSA
jgi:F0F1-type ATP synthase beta subunit